MGILSKIRAIHLLRFRFFFKDDESAKLPEVRLMEAIEKKDPVAVKALLKSGADMHYPDQHHHKDWPIRSACFQGDLRIVAMLCEMGADVNAQNLSGPGAPLRLAAIQRHQPVIRHLLKRGAFYSKNIISSLPADRIALIHAEIENLKQGARKPEPAATQPPRSANPQLLAKIKAVESEVRRDLSMTIWPDSVAAPLEEKKKPQPALAPKIPEIRKTRMPSSVVSAVPDIGSDSIGLDDAYGIDTNLLDLEMLERAGQDDPTPAAPHS